MIPVPNPSSTRTRIKSRTSRISGRPNHNSASAAAFASLSIVTGTPVSLLNSDARGQLRHLKCGMNQTRHANADAFDVPVHSDELLYARTDFAKRRPHVRIRLKLFSVDDSS